MMQNRKSPFEVANCMDLASLNPVGRLSAARLFADGMTAVANGQTAFALEVFAAIKTLCSTPLRSSADVDAAMVAFANSVSKAIDASGAKSDAVTKAIMAELGKLGLKVSSEVTKQ